MLNVMIAVLVFGLIIIMHEFGHFLMAKRTGVKVEEFAVGFGPRLLGFKKGETLYSIRFLPVGGFVRMAGTGPEEQDTQGRGFNDKTVLQRMAIIVAGPAMNFLLAALAFTLLFWAIGVPVNDPADTQIGEVLEGFPAEGAGIRPGDEVLAINGQQVNSWAEMVRIIQENPEREVLLTIKRNGNVIQVPVTPATNEKLGSFGFIGVRPVTRTVKYGLLESIGLGVVRTGAMMVVWFKGIVLMLTKQVEADIAGPVGITEMLSQAVTMGLGYLVHLVGALNAVIGIINLLPVPALDGSRLVFLSIEGVRGRPVDPARENFIHFVGLVFLMILALFITYQDIIRLGV